MFLRKYKKVFNLRAKDFHYPKYKKNVFLRKYKKFFRVDFLYFFIFQAWTEKCAR